MGDLTKNLSRYEIKCKCGECDQDTIDYMIVIGFQKICDKAAEVKKVEKVKAIVTSGNRCPWHNGAVGGKQNSFHPKSKAIDFEIEGFYSKELITFAQLVLDCTKYDYYLIDDKRLHLEYDVH